ncbi:hypothetical protein QQ045_027241 [Rhodiola kirilowii]
MSTANKNHRRGRLPEKSSSFHGKSSDGMEARQLRRPSTLPNLLATNSFDTSSSPDNHPRPTKLLLNVTMLGSFGPVRVVMSMEATVADLIASAVGQYVKEGRRPVMPNTDPSRFDVHYSQFYLECLDREEKLVNVWSRNLLLCPSKDVVDNRGWSCTEQAARGAKVSSPWLRLMGLLL